MRSQRPSLRWWILLIPVLLFSCVSQRKVSTTKKDLTTVDSTLLKQKSELAELQQKAKTKVDQNELDDTGSEKINKYINKTQAEIDNLRQENTVRIGSAVVNKADWDKLLKTLSFARQKSADINDKIKFLSDLISRNMVVRIDQDVVFEPGKYSVSNSMSAAIGRLFEPAATEIDNFTNKYPNFPLSLVITAKGYADATTISPGSALYNDLKDKMKLSNQDPDNKALNKELSEERAKSVIELFKKFAAGRAGNKMYLEKVMYLHEGKGESFPNPKVTDYKTDDPRRRVVYLFWSVFPDE